MNNKVLIIGSGGREHALAWKLKQSPRVGKIFVAPGNAGTALVGENVSIPVTDIGGLVQFAQNNKIDLTIVGSDDPLALGVVDAFLSKGLKIWGPVKAAAQLEWSKKFAKEIMAKAMVPTAHYQAFDDYNHAWEYVKQQGAPIVIKASGLALGKGVTVCQTLDEAENALRDIMLNKIHGEAGSTVVVEEYLEGKEFSVHAFSDGKNFKMFPPSQDHKRAYDGDKGPNTGGMGTVAPLPWVTKDIMHEIAYSIVAPTLDELRKMGTPFVGLLYPGIMLTKDGPKVIEFNSRFGDPEAQSYMRLLKTDLLDILEASIEGKLDEIGIEWKNKSACCIVLASGGYPGKYEKGKEITGIEEAEKLEDIAVFHAGTSVSPLPLPRGSTSRSEGRGYTTNGGRVLGVTATGNDLKAALEKAYAAVKLIHFDGMEYRKDIGAKSLA